MLFLVFQLGDDRYAIEATHVVEVLPLVNWKSIPRAPVGVTGIIDYRGKPIPLVDLTELALGKRSRMWMSTRIIVVDYRADSGRSCQLALIAEQATETIRRTETDFELPGLTVVDAPYLGPITGSPEGPIQRIEIVNLLPSWVREQLFQESAPPSA